MVYELQQKHPAFCPAKELDAKLQVVTLHKPVFPPMLAGKADQGQAVVEVVIDGKGEVQLPRVVSATYPEFGYAAAQALSMSKFAPPTRGGKPVAVRVKIPISFKGPKAGAAGQPAAPPASDDE
jgi:TonB family protein